MLKVRSGSVSVGSLGPGMHKVLFEPSEHLWWVRGLILTQFHPSYLLTGASPLPLDMGYLFWWNPTFSSQQLFSKEL